MKKVYFSGSITGGRRDAEVYAKIICKLKERFVVLTEHIGDPELTELGEPDRSAEEIYETDTKFIRECDLLVAEVTQVSMGVGYELAYAEALGKPIYCFVDGNKNKNLTAMLRGNHNLNIYTYYDLKEVFEKIDKID